MLTEVLAGGAGGSSTGEEEVDVDGAEVGVEEVSSFEVVVVVVSEAEVEAVDEGELSSVVGVDVEAGVVSKGVDDDGEVEVEVEVVEEDG